MNAILIGSFLARCIHSLTYSRSDDISVSVRNTHIRILLNAPISRMQMWTIEKIQESLNAKAHLNGKKSSMKSHLLGIWLGLA